MIEMLSLALIPCIALTCKSFMGFQSCSTKMTVSAPVRLRPRPPTLVLSSSRSMLGSALNLDTMECLMAGGTDPSSRR